MTTENMEQETSEIWDPESQRVVRALLAGLFMHKFLQQDQEGYGYTVVRARKAADALLAELDRTEDHG